MDTAGIRKQLAHAIRRDVWFGDTWHFPGMARAAEIVEKGEVMISPQESGVTTTQPQHPFEYWNKRIREDVIKEILAEAALVSPKFGLSYKHGLERAAELVSGE